MRVEDLLNGGFAGLYGEVVTCDVYQLREVKFTPRIIYDIGSNVGVFARYARSIWPNAIIICLEPDPDNFENLVKFTKPDNMIFINKAIGQGQIWKCLGAPNGAHESYLSETTGYPALLMSVDARVEKSSVETVLLNELIGEYGTDSSILKLDCEGGEAAIFNHPPSMEALSKIDYLCGEVHNMASHGGLSDQVKKETLEAMKFLNKTHEMRTHGPAFWGFRR